MKDAYLSISVRLVRFVFLCPCLASVGDLSETLPETHKVPSETMHTRHIIDCLCVAAMRLYGASWGLYDGMRKAHQD